LARGEGYYIDTRGIIEFHKEHTLLFNQLQQKLGVISRLEICYGRLSAIIHGHIPGAWAQYTSMAQIGWNKAIQDSAVQTFVESSEVVHRFFLCATGRQLWDSFSTQGKKALLAGLAGEDKKALGLDAV
jgi:hypothetical protein